MFDVSIIIRSKNEEDYLGSCLQSIKKQTIKNIEIILVDNFSTDATCAVAKSFGIKKIIKIKKYKPGFALNLGIKESDSEFICCLSAHCIPKNKFWLETLINSIRLDPKIAGVYGRQLPLPFTSYDNRRDLTLTFGTEDRLQKIDYMFHNANSLIKRSIWNKIKFDKNVSNIEDRIWAKKTLSRGYKVYYSSKAEVFHHHGLHQHDAYQSFRAKSVVSVIDKTDPIKDLVFPKELIINPDEVPVFIPLKKNAKNLNEKKKILNQIIKNNNIKNYFIYGYKKEHKIFNKYLLDRSKFRDENKELSEVLKNALNLYEKKFKLIPKAVGYVVLNYKYPIKRLLNELLKKLYLGGFSVVFPAFEDRGSYWVEERSEFTEIGRRDEPINRGLPLYRACYGLGSFFRTSRLRFNSLFKEKIGVKKFYNPINTIRD
jgi:glycosyltransferase involved in cell wall biosynthesis